MSKFAWKFMDQADGTKCEDNTHKVKYEHPNDGTGVDNQKRWLISILNEADCVSVLFWQCVQMFVNPIFCIYQVESRNLEQGLNEHHSFGWKKNICVQWCMDSDLQAI